MSKRETCEGNRDEPPTKRHTKDRDVRGCVHIEFEGEEFTVFVPKECVFKDDVEFDINNLAKLGPYVKNTSGVMKAHEDLDALSGLQFMTALICCIQDEHEIAELVTLLVEGKIERIRLTGKHLFTLDAHTQESNMLCVSNLSKESHGYSFLAALLHKRGLLHKDILEFIQGKIGTRDKWEIEHRPVLRDDDAAILRAPSPATSILDPGVYLDIRNMNQTSLTWYRCPPK